MSLTITEVERRQSVGNYFEKLVDVTFDSSYPTGGEPLTASDLGFGSVLSVVGDVLPSGAVRYVAYDRTNSKLLAFDADGAQIADTTSLATITVRLLVRGRG